MLSFLVCAGTVPPGIKPILVFVNTKSGPQKGWKLRRKFLRMLHPLQVPPVACGGADRSCCFYAHRSQSSALQLAKCGQP